MPGHKQAQPTEQEAELKRLRAQVKQLEMENDILKKASAFSSHEPKVSSSMAKRIHSQPLRSFGSRLSREEPEVRFSFIAEQQVFYPVIILCKVMRVSRSGYYGYLQRLERAPTAKKVKESKLVNEIKAIHEESKKHYGSPRMLISASWQVGGCVLASQEQELA